MGKRKIDHEESYNGAIVLDPKEVVFPPTTAIVQGSPIEIEVVGTPGEYIDPLHVFTYTRSKEIDVFIM